MSLTRAQLITRIRRESGNTNLQDDQIGDIIDSVIRKITSKVYSKFMETSYTFSTVDGTAEYVMPPNLDKIRRVRCTTSGNEQVFEPIVNIDSFWDENPNPSVEGAPYRYFLENVDTTGVSYSTGTLTSTVNSRTWVGASTLWVTAGIKPGTRLTFSGKVYNVASVSSETGLITVQKAHTGLSGQSYTLETIFDQKMRLDPIPDGVYTVIVDYWKQPSPMINDADFPEIKGKFADGIIKGGVAEVRAYDEDSAWYLVAKDDFDDWIADIATWNEDELDEAEVIEVNNFRRYNT